MNAERLSVGEVCSVRMGYSFRQKLVWTPLGNTCVVQPKDVSTNGVLSLDADCRLTLAANNHLKKGDVLLINRGRFTATLFDIAPDFPCVASSAFYILAPLNPARLLPEYLALFMNSAAGQCLFRRQIKTTTIPFISLDSLSRIAIPVPSVERQRVLVNFGKIIHSYARLSAEKLRLHQQLLARELAFPNQENVHA